ncbi:MAG: DEAD/DEAH box helicase [Bacteroidia bacterium]
MSFENLGLIEPIQRALKTEGYIKPTPIQEQSIPIILDRKDLLGCAQTGTGKTAAFSIPILQILHEQKQNETRRDRHIKALIVTPTRELAIQIDESIQAYGRFTGLTHSVIFGGVSQRPQLSALQRGVDILVATPGRLLDLVNQGYINLSHLAILVLDEADRMLDMGFIHDVKKILALVPPKRQSLFFSATMPPAIVKLAGTILQNPVKVEVNPIASTAEKVQQSVYFVDKDKKGPLLIHVLSGPEVSSALIFTRTKYGADKLATFLNRAGVKSDAIHGNKSQEARQKALNNFKKGKTRVLVATDIASRGIDVDDLSHVINYEIPNVPDTYVHRIGRTGRAGAEGIALSFCDSEEMVYLRDIHKLIDQTVPVVEDHPFPMMKKMSMKPAPSPKQKRNNFSPGKRRKVYGRVS